MINKIKLILYICLLVIFNNSSISDEFKIKSNSINVTDEGNILNAIGDVEVESNNNLIISSERSILDKKKSLVISSGNVFLVDKTNNLKIKSDEMKFSRIDNKAVITGNSEIILEDNYTLSSDQVIYDKNINSVYSNDKSILLDKNGNKIEFSKFNLDLNKKKAKVFDLNLKDINKNNFILKEAFVDLKNGEIAGKDLKLFFDKYASKIMSFGRPTRDRLREQVEKAIDPLENFEIKDIGKVESIVLPGLQKPATLEEVNQKLARRIADPMEFAKGLVIRVLPHAEKHLIVKEFNRLASSFKFLLERGLACAVMPVSSYLDLLDKTKNLRNENPMIAQNLYLWEDEMGADLILQVTKENASIFKAIIINRPIDYLI